MLKWVFERVDGHGEAVDTPIGRLPTHGALDTDGLDIAEDDLAALLAGRHRRLAVRRSRRSASTSPSSATSCPALLHMAVDTLEAKLG